MASVQGYPVHVPAREFLAKYHCLATWERDLRPSDEKQAAARILQSLGVPDTEWQIGKSKVFLRNSVFDPLEVRRKKLLSEKMVIIQKAWRGYVARQRFLRVKAAVVVIQKHFRGSKLRRRFVRMRRAAVTIQAHLRGMLARDLVAALRRKREEELAKQRRRRRAEEARLAKERAEISMEESYRSLDMLTELFYFLSSLHPSIPHLPLSPHPSLPLPPPPSLVLPG